ncbi:unnamed protein product [Brassicogethes aeneus]|uniref:Uncharacterized protein n=1 Tax=Brassicogethes aeneus TaxID=1431903 RepID=A0A9P0AXG6_BRAAE|nr:unnamed protein product [Brassicogethes aeneus]
MKYLVIFFVGFAVVSQFVWGLKDSNFDDGDCDGNGMVIYEEVLKVKYAFMKHTTRTRNVCTPDLNSKIKCVQVKDLRHDGLNGDAEITEGGPGHDLTNMKYLVIILVGLAVAVWGLKDSNIDAGVCDGEGHIAYEETMEIPWAFADYMEETRDICTPSNNTTIKCVEIKDLRNDGTNGKAKITEGGPGHKCVTIKFKSQFNRGMEFNITVWSNNNTLIL